jgi:hypothetical protein
MGAGNSWVVLNALSKLAASLMAALSVVFVYFTARDLGRRIGTGEASALATAVVYAVATPTWAVSSQGLWGHAPAQQGSRCLGALRADGALGPRWRGWGSFVTGPHDLRRPSLRSLPSAAWAGGVAFVARSGWSVAPLGGNLATFGTLQGGYTELHRTHAEHHGVASAWSGSFLEGLLGVLVSPSRGLFVYAPVLLFPVAGLGLWLSRRRGGLLACAAAVTALGIGTIAMFSVWWGGHSFGPRLVTDVLPALVLGLVPIWPVAWGRGSARLPAGGLRRPVAVEAVGAFHFPSPRDVEWNTSPRNVDQAHDRLWDWRDPQLLRLLRNGPAPPGFRTVP